MSSKRLQLSLDLAPPRAFGRDDFLVTASNAAAAAAVERWRDWSSPILFLIGPPGSGKSHLAEIWRSDTGARSVLPSDLRAEAVPEFLASGALLMEDALTPLLEERAMFHLINLAREQRAFVLVTTTVPPARWPVSLPDLASRLRASATAELEPPDDDLLRGVLVKHFTDRQIAADEALVSYLMSRMERSLDAARSLVAELDRRALAEKARITRTFAARVLAQIEGGET